MKRVRYDCIQQMAVFMDSVEQNRRAVGNWLLAMCGLVLVMIVVGGLTRLTQSGLSMVEWQPILGSIPPLNHDDWMVAFEKYQQYPEYQKVNQGMSLKDFKFIFYFEYGHRMLGRFIGLSFALPFVYFLSKKAISRSFMPWLFVLFCLGGAQGLIGWWMVKSGLIDRPDVSHYRLTVHLSMAFMLYLALLWTGLNYRRGLPLNQHVSKRRAAAALLLLGYVTVQSGGLVAGLNAGSQFNTFPKMAGQWIPDGLFVQQPWYTNMTENLMTVQFDHRMLAITTATLSIAFAIRHLRGQRNSRVKKALWGLLLAVSFQVTLGISTLLSVVWLPLASAHQTGAVVFLSSLIWVLHELSFAQEDSLATESQLVSK